MRQPFFMPVHDLFFPDHVNRQTYHQHHAKLQADHNILRHDDYLSEKSCN
jgi:hypothetical protein